MPEPSARARDAVVSALALLASRVYRDERDADVTNVMALVDAYAEQAVARRATVWAICGQSKTTLALNMAPERTQGCGHPIQNADDLFRCADCAVPFHRGCLRRHCEHEIVSLGAEVEGLKDAVERVTLEKYAMDRLHEEAVATSAARVEAEREGCAREAETHFSDMTFRYGEREPYTIGREIAQAIRQRATPPPGASGGA